MFAPIMRLIGVALVFLALTVGAGLRFDNLLWVIVFAAGLALIGTDDYSKS